MFGFVLLLVGLSGPASAQMPGLGVPGMALGMPSASTRYVVAEAASKRFPGEDLAGPTFAAGEQVELIVEDGGKARIRQGERYGWVAADQLTAMAPAPAAGSTPLLPGGMPSLPGGNPLLGGLKPLVPAPPAPPAPKTP